MNTDTEGHVGSGDPPGHYTKQTSLEMRGAEPLPHRADADPRPTDEPLIIEGDGPEALMEGLHQADPAERRKGVAQARMETEVKYAQDCEHEVAE